MTKLAAPAPAPRPPAPRTRHLAPLRRRSVQLAVAGWVLAHLLLLALAGGHLPFHASALAEPPALDAVLRTDAMLLEVFVLMAVVHLLTQRRPRIDLAARAPARPGGARGDRRRAGLRRAGHGRRVPARTRLRLARVQLPPRGMVIRTGQPVVPAEALCWAGSNLVAFAVLPLIAFRRRYSGEQLNLRSADRRADLVLILVVLALESAVQLAVTSPSILDLTLHQALLGAPLTFALGFAGTVLPTMVFVYCILTPRYLRLTGSVPATVILGGVTYALLHFFDGWTTFADPVDALMSVLFLLLFYTGPGMFKTFLTVRTGNAWVHVWAYHAIAPHTLVDSPMMVRTFGIS